MTEFWIGFFDTRIWAVASIAVILLLGIFNAAGIYKRVEVLEKNNLRLIQKVEILMHCNNRCMRARKDGIYYENN